LTGQNYEGRTGASAREVRMLLMNTAQHEERSCVSPLDLFEEIRALVSEKSVFPFLKQDPQGDFLNQDKILDMLNEAYLDLLEDEAAEAMGLVTETKYVELLNRYILHITHWLKKESLPDPITGKPVPPDMDMIKEVEEIIRPDSEEEEKFRKNLIGRIGAYVLEAGKEAPMTGPPDFAKVFPSLFEKIKEDFFEKRKGNIQKTYIKFLDFMDGKEIEGKAGQTVALMKETMSTRFGYCDHCVKEAMAFLLRHRYQ